MLAETNCNTAVDEVEWARDWHNGSAYWASYRQHPGAGGSHRGMALFVADSVPFENAKVLHRDPGGRSLIVRARIHHRDTVIIGFHADNSADAPPSNPAAAANAQGPAAAANARPPRPRRDEVVS